MYARALIIATIAIAAPAAAQSRPALGASVEWRSQAGAITTNETARTGVGVHVFAEGRWSAPIGWRIDAAYAQAHYDSTRTPANFTTSTSIDEHDVELSALARVTLVKRGAWRAFGAAGPVASWRGSASSVGWGVVAGTRHQRAPGGWAWLVEGRVLRHVTWSAGGTLVAVSVGVER